MSGLLRWFGVLALAALLLATAAGEGRAQGKRRTTFDGLSVVANPVIQPQMRLGQLAFNTAFVGNALRQVPPNALGFNPFGNSLATAPSLSPFSLSTAAFSNPYGAMVSSGSGYSASTSPYGSPSSPYGDSSNGYSSDPTAGTLRGLASLTSAEGQYWLNIGKARISREQSRQASLDTARKQVEFERCYESTRPTAPQLRDRERATDLARARTDPPATEVWSGKALNDLLRSIQGSSMPLSSGPNVPLEEDTLKQSNLSDRSSHGNIGMLKDNGNLAWPESLKESAFDEPRNRLSRNLRIAIDQLKHKEPIEASQLNDINGDFKALNARLHDSADQLSPSQYIGAKRYLNQLAAAVKALSDPRVVNYFNNTWNARGKNVAELVANMTREGLVFAPASPGEEAAYNAVYQALRSFEAGVRGARQESSEHR
jgi:hypothetical protein